LGRGQRSGDDLETADEFWGSEGYDREDVLFEKGVKH